MNLAKIADGSPASNNHTLASDGVRFVVEIDNSQRWAMSMVGHVLLCHRQIGKAIAIFEALHQIDSDDCYTLRSLIYLYVECERYLEAIELVRILEKTQSEDKSVNSLCGLMESKALWCLGRHAEAQRCFKKYLTNASSLEKYT